MNTNHTRILIKRHSQQQLKKKDNQLMKPDDSKLNKTKGKLESNSVQENTSKNKVKKNLEEKKEWYSNRKESIYHSKISD